MVPLALLRGGALLPPTEGVKQTLLATGAVLSAHVDRISTTTTPATTARGN
jgi:hypothetical protein